MEKNWIPHSRSAQLVMAKRWVDLLPGKEKEWQIPRAMIQRMRELTADAELLHARTDDPKATKGDEALARTAFHELVTHMKDLRAKFGFYTAADGSGLYRPRFPVHAS